MPQSSWSKDIKGPCPIDHQVSHSDVYNTVSTDFVNLWTESWFCAFLNGCLFLLFCLRLPPCLHHVILKWKHAWTDHSPPPHLFSCTYLFNLNWKESLPTFKNKLWATENGCINAGLISFLLPPPTFKNSCNSWRWVGWNRKKVTNDLFITRRASKNM